MNDLKIDAQEGAVPTLGPGVFGRIGRLVCGGGVRIGAPPDSSFKRTAGVHIDVDELVLEDGVVIEREVSLKGKRIRLGRGTRVKSGAALNAYTFIDIGAAGTVGEDCEITGHRIRIGRQLWMLPNAKIGGGSATDIDSELTAGPWLHLGIHTFLNTAKAITLGREIGLGTRTALYTHGAYPSMLRGAPVSFAPISIGDYSWLPGATVNPGVSIGKHCVIGVNSLVAKDIPDGAMAAGSPAKVVRANAYPQALDDAALEAKMRGFFADYAHLLTDKHTVNVIDRSDELRIELDGGRAAIVWRLDNAQPARDNEIRLGRVAHGGATNVSLDANGLNGRADADANRLVNQLRRYGVRFDVEARGGVFVPWESVW